MKEMSKNWFVKHLFSSSCSLIVEFKFDGLTKSSEISTSIWQKKNVNRFEQFWVEICLDNFVCKIQNPGQITWRWFKKGNQTRISKKVDPFGVIYPLNHNYQKFDKFWVETTPKEGSIDNFFSVKLMWKSRKQFWYLVNVIYSEKATKFRKIFTLL